MHHCRLRLDRLEVDDVRFSTYSDHREVRPFQLLCTYLGWLMCGKERVYRHLPERVKRQLFYVHDVSRHSSDAYAVADHRAVKRSGVVLHCLGEMRVRTHGIMCLAT